MNVPKVVTVQFRVQGPESDGAASEALQHAYDKVKKQLAYDNVSLVRDEVQYVPIGSRTGSTLDGSNSSATIVNNMMVVVTFWSEPQGFQPA